METGSQALEKAKASRRKYREKANITYQELSKRIKEKKTILKAVEQTFKLKNQIQLQLVRSDYQPCSQTTLRPTKKKALGIN